MEFGVYKNFALLLYKGNGYKNMNFCLQKGITEVSCAAYIESLQHLLLAKEIKDSIEVYRFVDYKE